MSKGGADTELEMRLSSLKEKFGDQVPLASIADIVKEIISSLHGDLSAQDIKIYQELESLVDYIHKAREDIASLSPEEISGEHIPTATDELDAIVAATEEATGTILDTVEEIENIAGTLEGEAGAKITEAVTKIYEACNFQDITGQRISKVIRALHHIESTVERLAGALGQDLKASVAELKKKREAEKAEKKELGEEDLLEGPQLAGEGVSQDEVDALLASFD